MVIIIFDVEVNVLLGSVYIVSFHYAIPGMMLEKLQFIDP